MATNLRRRMLATAVMGATALAGVGVAATAAGHGPGGAQLERVASVHGLPLPLPFPFPWTTPTTKAPVTTTTKPPSTTTTKVPTPPSTSPTTAPPKVTTTTGAPTPPTTTRPSVTTTTKPPATTTTRPPATTTTTKAPTTTTTRPPVPVTAPPVVSSGLSASAQADMLAQVNAKRATGTTCGGTAYPAVPALALQGTLTAAAAGHANEMASQNYFSHTGLNGSDPGTRITAAGYRWRAWAENIAAGQTTPASVMAAWFASADHCENFMSSTVTQIGFALATNPSSTYRNYWVADMGRPA